MTGIVLAVLTTIASARTVGVYVGEGTEGLSAASWLEIVHFSPELEAVPLDASSVKNGALVQCASLVLPDGDTQAMAAAFGEEGLQNLRSFIKKGSHCLATGGGAHLLSLGSLERNRGSILPYQEGEGFGTGATDELQVDFIPELAKEFPIRRAERRRLAWDGCPPFVQVRLEPSELDELASFKVAGRFRGDLNLDGEQRKSLRQQITDVYGTYGQGRVWATICHSEYTPANRDITKMLLEYVSGGKVTWQLPQRVKGQLAVSVVIEGALGVEGTRQLVKLLDDPALDVAVMLPAEYDGFWLRHTDILVRSSELTSSFKLVNARRVSPSERFKVLPRKKDPNSVKAVLYCGPGVGDAELFNFATILDDSPKYSVECQDGSKFASGSLKNKDFLLVAGGYSSQIYYAINPGAEAIRDFLFNGGTYYGACAGSFVTLQPREGGFKEGLGLVPFKARSSPYRGHSHPYVTFSDKAVKEWGLNGASHKVLYWGGPEHDIGDPIEDTEVEVLARYACSTIDTYGGNGLAMKDWSAIIGGRLGKGKIVSTAVHPEEDETQFYLVYAALRYLHGKQPKPTPVSRRRNALAVGYFMPFAVSAEMMDFALELRRDTRFDVRPQSEHMDISGYARHLDAYVFGNGFKNARLQDETVEFFRRGGHGIFVSANAAECAKIKSLTKDFPHIHIVPTFAEAKVVLERLAADYSANSITSKS